MKLKHYILFFLAFTFIYSVGLIAQAEKPVEPVNWRELIPFLIDIPNWEAEGDAEGRSMTMGNFKISQAERSYTSNDKSLDIDITDGGYIPMVYAGIKMAMNFEIDTSEEYVKKITIKGFPGVEKYNYENKEAEVMILVADRFLVILDGSPFKDTSELKAIAEILDLEGIANLAK